MRVRILSEWAGSGRCGEVCDVPDTIAHDRIRGGFAEAVPLPPEPHLETAVVSVAVETGVASERRRGKRG